MSFLVVKSEGEYFIEPDGLQSNDLESYEVINEFQYYYQADKFITKILKEENSDEL